MAEIQAVCFDAFGTLVDVKHRQRTFLRLLEQQPSTEAIQSVLTHPVGMRELAKMLTTHLDGTRADIEAEIEAECASFRMRPIMEWLWSSVRRSGLKIGICTNLVLPYEQPLLACLPGCPDALVLSVRTGLRKPQEEMYQMVCRELRLRPSEVLFVGDSMEEDVLGPRSAGLLGMHIDEFEVYCSAGPSFRSKRELVELFKRILIPSL